jgi:hypothetical protein
LYLVNRSGNRPSVEGAAERFDQARRLCREAGFQRLTFRGDTFTQTRHQDRWDADGVRFVFGRDASANVVVSKNSIGTPQCRVRTRVGGRQDPSGLRMTGVRASDTLPLCLRSRSRLRILLVALAGWINEQQRDASTICVRRIACSETT